MTGFVSRRWWLGLVGLAWLGVVASSDAWERPPVKVNTVFQFRVDVKFGPDIQRPTAPWYSYFPIDQRMLPSPQATPYPPWPMTFPPPGPPADASKDAIRKMSAENGATPTTYWPTYQTNAAAMQPVGYVPMQAPSYWYRDR
jgi:hypothetical protein